VAAAAVDAGRRPVGPGSEIDARDDQGHELHLIVDTVEPNTEDKDGDVSFYGMRVRDASGAFVTYCSPDAEGKSRAIPLKGSWDERGGPVPGSESKVTFACTSGAIGKCVRNGYKPWKTVNGKSLAPYHAACVRMIRADYCGDGRPHTKDGTQLDIWDPLGVQKRDERPGHPEVFEAAWSPAGAEYLVVPRWSESADEIVRECPDKLRGRTAADKKVAIADLEKTFPEALMFNARFVRDEDRMPKKKP
jgi:hypothetical protein